MNHHAKRKFEVFVGSAFKELREARQQIINAIALAGHIPCGTELWPAETHKPITAIVGYLDFCDIHVLIVGHRYGSLAPAEPGSEAISFTHWEYNRSIEAGRPTIVFSLSEDVIKAKREEGRKDAMRRRAKELGKPANELPELEGEFGTVIEEKFRQFRLGLQNAHLRVTFPDTDTGYAHLFGQCIAALSRLTAPDVMPASSGWIRANSSEGKTLRAIDGNPFLKRVTDQIRQFETLGERVEENKMAKQAMARHFWFYMQSRIRVWKGNKQDGSNLFFESGSSLAYVGQEFETAVLDEAGVPESWHIRTNNIICLLQFDLNSVHDARCFPNGKPDPRDKYGAIFPKKWGALHREPPRFPRKLSLGEKRAIDEIQKAFSTDGPTIVLAAASGWDIDSKDLLIRGPHVGSHKNMLFKRAIFTTNFPVILFMDADKLGSRCSSHCYPVFGPEMPMTKAMKEYPIAICVGWEWPKPAKRKVSPDELKEYEKRNEPEWIGQQLTKIGFTHEFFCERDEDTTGVRRGAILRANQRFIEELPL